MVKQYSSDFKKSAVEKMLSPTSPGSSKLAQNLGVPIATLYGWKEKYAKQTDMNKYKSIKKMSREEKLEILIKTSSMSEHDLGAFLRENGLYANDLAVIKDDILKGSSAVPQKPKFDPELVKLKQEVERTKKDLKRKDRALAEMSARVVLLKKSHEIWGDPEDDE